MQTSIRSTTDSTQHGDLPTTESDGGNSWKRLCSSLGLARDDDDEVRNKLLPLSVNQSISIFYFLDTGQDDEVAAAVEELRKVGSFDSMDSIQRLNSTTFRTFTQDQQQTVFVLFHVTCEHKIIIFFYF